MLITKEILKERVNYEDMLEWFNDNSIDSIEYQEILNILSETPSNFYLAEWLLNTFGMTNLILEVDDINTDKDIYFSGTIEVEGSIKTSRNITVNGSIVVKGDIKANDIISNGAIMVGGNITAGGYVTSNNGIDVGKNITVDRYIKTNGSIRVGRSLRSGNIFAKGGIKTFEDLISDGSVESEETIVSRDLKVRRDIFAGWNIHAESISASGIMAGLNNNGDSNRITSLIKPENIIRGRYIKYE